MIRLSLVMLMLTASALLRAQNTPPTTFTVKGILLDSLSQEAEPYATIRFTKKDEPDKAVKMAITKNDGKFQEKITGAGDYVLTITSIGRRTIEKDFTLKSGEATYDFGTLYASDATNELAGVEIVAQKPLVKVDIDKIEYNVVDDPDSKSNTVIEMLRKVPLVTVDGEDNIQVNGSSNFKVHVNGKPNNMMSSNPKEVFRSMPANTIKHIEVITDPGAKYDAEGVGGILNIVTIDGSGSNMEGYTATFTGRGSNTGVGGGIYATVQKNKLTMTGNYGYNYDDSPKSYSNNTREYTKSGESLVSSSSNKGDRAFQQGNLEASYEIDTLRLVTLAFGMWGGSSDSKGNGSSQMGSNYSYKSQNKNDMSWYSIRGNIDYQRLFKVKNRMLTFSYRINTQPQTNDSYTDYIDRNIADEWLDVLNLQNQRYDQKMNTTEHTFQVDYVTPIGKYHTIGFGSKYIIRNNNSDTKYFVSDNQKDYELDAKRSSNFKHLNDILAAYGEYTLRYKILSVKAGVRYEYTNQNVKYVDTPANNFKADFNDVVPSATFGFKISDTQNIRFGYNLRIWRPSIYFLNPYRDTSNPTSISQGNPNLESEKSHALNLTYSTFSSKFSLNLSLRHSFNNNGIESITTLQDDGILFTTYENIGKSRSSGLSLYANWNASPKTRININGGGSYNNYKRPATNASEALQNSGWSFYGYSSAQQTLPWDLRASLNVGGSTPWTSLQGKGYGYFFYSLSLNKSFVDKRLTLSVFASNFFDKYRNYKNTMQGAGFKDISENKYPQRRFGISVSYRIGELKAQVKKAVRSIENDDVKEGGGSGGSQGGE